MSNRISVVVNDGKYTFTIPDGDYRVHVLRYGEPWLIIEAGHNAIAALMYEVQALREETEPA